MTANEKYKIRLKQIEDGSKEVYEGEAEVIRQILDNANITSVTIRKGE